MKLEKAIKFKNGKKRNYEIGNIPVYGGNGILGYTNNYNAEKNNIIIGRVGAYCGCVYRNNDECWISDNAIVGNVKEGFDYNFIYYLLKSINLNSLHIGSSHPLMTQEILNNIEINIPAYDYQKRAAKILNIIDQKIELNIQTNDNLQKIARNQFYELFANKKVNAKFKDLVNIKKKAIKASNKNTNLGYYPIDMLPMNYLVTQNCKSNEEANSSLIEFSKYDILLGSMRVYFHRVCLAADDGITRNTTFVFEPKQKELLYYALLLIDRDEFIDYANKTSKGSTMPYAVWEALSEYEIYLPENNEISDFSNLMYPLFEKIILNEKENRILEQLRDTLLPKLMNGEIDLDKIEI